MTNADETLLTVLYSSNATHPFDDRELGDLLAQSRASNSRNDLTGMLLYRRGRFVQILEGPERTVRDLIETIRADERHTDVRVLIEEPITARAFADWTMGYQSVAEPTEAAPAGFRDTFDDLDSTTDATATLRAARELSLWFRVRARQAG